MPDVVYFVRDLLFTSKIREICKQLGLSATGVPDPAGLATAASSAKLVVLDLRLDRALDALAALRSAGVATPTVGFCDHERTELMDAARAQGCREVLTKGQLARELPRLLGA